MRIEVDRRPLAYFVSAEVLMLPAEVLILAEANRLLMLSVADKKFLVGG